MFDPEKAIAAWRGRLAGTGSFFEGDLDELEGHLRDHLDALEEVELTGERAFQIALERIGEPGALGDEFAKVNRALVWRGPLFWLTAGCFATLVGQQLLQALAFAASRFVPTLVPLGAVPTCVLVYAIQLGGPVALVAGLLAWARTYGGARDPLGCAASPAGRVALVAGGALVWLGVRVVGYPLSNVESVGVPAHVRWAAIEALDLSWRLSEILRPLGVIALVIALRAVALARAKRTGSQPSRSALFWVALGAAIASAAQELDGFAAIMASFGAACSRLDLPRTQLVVGLVTLATPALSCAAAWVWSHRDAPSPDDFLRSRRIAWVFAVGSAAVLGAYVSRGYIVMQTPDWVADGSLLECLRIHSQGKVITAACSSVLVGALMLRARAGMLAAATESKV